MPPPPARRRSSAASSSGSARSSTSTTPRPRSAGRRSRAREWLAHPGSVGRPWDGADVKILDDDGEPVPPGTVGHIWMRNVRPFEYHNDPDKTAANRRGDYVTVGDLGSLDADGFLYLADRRTDLILSGGVNVYPAEIEAALLAHPGVADAAVVGDARRRPRRGGPRVRPAGRSTTTASSTRSTPTAPPSSPGSSGRARSSCATPSRAARPASSCAESCATSSPPAERASRTRVPHARRRGRVTVL